MIQLNQDLKTQERCPIQSEQRREDEDKFQHKYEGGGEEMEKEFEYIQAWDKKVLVARMTLGKGG